VTFHRDITRSASLTNEAEQLVARYPRLEPAEVDRLVEIYPRLGNVDVALMISDEQLGPKLESFSRAQRHRLRMPPMHLFGLLSPFLLFVVVMAWVVFI
jgi:hypothetical protein